MRNKSSQEMINYLDIEDMILTDPPYRTHLESMRRKCRQWFIETFESFLNNQSNWEEANPNIHKEIGKKVKELQTVRAQILRAIDRLGKLNDHVFDEMY